MLSCKQFDIPVQPTPAEVKFIMKSSDGFPDTWREQKRKYLAFIHNSAKTTVGFYARRALWQHYDEVDAIQDALYFYKE